MGRDIIDLAFMAAYWGNEPLREGFHIATEAYGKVVASAARRAATKMIEQAAWRRRCVTELDVSDTRTLLAGLKVIVAGMKIQRGL